MVLLHVVHNSGLRSGVFACLVRHRDVAGVGDGECDGFSPLLIFDRKSPADAKILKAKRELCRLVVEEANSLLASPPTFRGLAWQHLSRLHVRTDILNNTFDVGRFEDVGSSYIRVLSGGV
jgi:hypothetical protein